tara:strand:+ start:188 stop:1048 length:861 start_codon:yes stop_codon:yes gene_type:complete
MSRTVYLFQGRHDYEPHPMSSRTDAQKAVMGDLFDGIEDTYHCPDFKINTEVDAKYFQHENAVPLFFTISDYAHEKPHIDCDKILTEKLTRDVIRLIAESVVGDGTTHGEISDVFPVSATGFRHCSARVGQMLKEGLDVTLNILYAYPCFHYGEHQDMKHKLPTHWELEFAFDYDPGNERRIPNVEVSEMGTSSRNLRSCADRIAQMELWTPASLYVAKKATVEGSILSRRDTFSNRDKPSLKMGKEMSYDDFYQMSDKDVGYWGKAEGKWSINAGVLQLVRGGDE